MRYSAAVELERILHIPDNKDMEIRKELSRLGFIFLDTVTIKVKVRGKIKEIIYTRWITEELDLNPSEEMNDSWEKALDLVKGSCTRMLPHGIVQNIFLPKPQPHSLPIDSTE